MSVHVIDHPLVQHKLAILRDRETGHSRFRALARELGTLLTYEATRDLPTRAGTVETPLDLAPSRMLDDPPPALVSILRAGEGLLSGALDLLPTAGVGHVGLYRNSDLEAVEYYFKMPPDMASRDVIVLDPMLATAGTAVAALDKLVTLDPRSLRFVCLVAAPEGVARLAERHPDVAVYTAALDARLDERGYIRPGLGDAGDRLFGTPH